MPNALRRSESSALALQPVVKDRFMKKAKIKSDKLRPEYNRSDFKKLERGKYHARVKESCNVVVLDPEVSSVFPNSDAVNRALHSLVEVAEAVTSTPSRFPRPRRIARRK